MSAWPTRGLVIVTALVGALAMGGGCGSGSVGDTGTGGGDSSATGNGGATSTGASLTTSTMSGSLVGSGMPQIKSLEVTPPNPTITSVNSVPVMQAFSAVAHYEDGTKQTITSGVSWGADGLQIGKIDNSGTFAANGSVGGTVDVQASFGGMKASTTLTVKLSINENSANAPPAIVTALEGATTPDASVVWAYPYDGTVWPRGLLPPTLQWNGGAATDVVMLHLANSTFDLEQFSAVPSAPTAQLPIDENIWDAFVESSSGPTSVTVARWDGQNATLLAQHTWTVAPGSMKGTIYYWSNDLGRVLRIQPGAQMPDDFATYPGSPFTDPAQFDQNTSCLMTCHSVSADGSTLVSGGGIYGGSVDLKTITPLRANGGTWQLDPNSFGQPSWTNVQWYASALSPDGKYVLVNSMAQLLVQQDSGPMGQDMDLFYTGQGGLMAMAGQSVPNSGALGVPFAQPAWSPDGSIVAFVDPGDPNAWGTGWLTPPPGDLKVMSFDESANPMFGAPTTLVATGGDPTHRIAWPTVTPDGKWILYSRTQDADTRDGNGDLYIASATTPNQEVRLAALDGDGYPFAAGARDLSWNFEPSFAPVASGGYFWVVFTSRRTYGNTLTGDKTQVKQLWVAAIDQNPKPGADPSHPAFHLTGQAANLAMRGFWALNPCKGDGQGCMSGTDCCGGYCDMNNGAVCSSTSGGCSQSGDKCTTDADCCGSSQGVTCINHVCSEAPPK